MAGRPPPNLTITSGRRGYYRWLYGTHYWIPEVQADWSHGMVRDSARVALPAGAVYDSADYLLHQPGVAQKRGGTSYPFAALANVTFMTSVTHVPFSAVGIGTFVVSLGSTGAVFHLFKGATDVGAVTAANYTPTVISPGAMYAIIPFNGTVNAQKYDGGSVTTLGAGMTLGHFASYKSRLVASGVPNLNRLFFSPTPDVNGTWDTTNSWIDCDEPVSGLAALNTALLVFSQDGMERIIGATPPPNTDMDRAPVSPIGCTDCRSIVQTGPYVFFANPEGIYMTNGSTPVSLTEQGGISTYWRSLFSGYVTAAPLPSASTWTICAGWYRGFLFVTVLDASRNLVATLMCNIAKRAWWRLSNIKAAAYASSVDDTELYYADASTNRIVAMSGIFSPAAGNKLDADGTAVTPTIEFAPFGAGGAVKAFGWGRLNYDMRDAASDNPVMAVTMKGGTEADTSWTPAESPLLKTTTMARSRFTASRNGQAATVALAQTNASAKTEIYAVELTSRSQPMTGEGVS